MKIISPTRILESDAETASLQREIQKSLKTQVGQRKNRAVSANLFPFVADKKGANAALRERAARHGSARQDLPAQARAFNHCDKTGEVFAGGIEGGEISPSANFAKRLQRLNFDRFGEVVRGGVANEDNFRLLLEGKGN